MPIDLHAFRASAAFALFGAAWILLSDRLLQLFAPQPEMFITLSAYKGLTFVALISVAVFVGYHERDKRLAQNQALFRDYVEHAPVAIVVWDEHGEIVLANPTSETMFDSGALVGRKFRDFFPADELPRLEESLLALERDGEAEAEHRVVLASGEERFVCGRSVRLSSTRYLGFVQDITARRRSEEQHKSLELQLRQAQKMEAIGTLAAGIAHDFNNVLQVVMTNATLLQTGEMSKEESALCVGEMVTASKQAAGLTRQLLQFSRREAVRSADVDVNELVQKLAKMLTRVLGEDVELETACVAGTPIIRGDAGMLEQVVMNLVVNARDAMPGGGRIGITTTCEGEHVVLSVSDTGEGIPADVLPHIFEPFFTTKSPGHGTGLGLATSYGIVGQHGGEITVSTELGRGTTFRIRLPLATPSQQATEPRSHGAASARGHETLLIVEDNAVVRRGAAHVLETAGYRVLQAGSSDAALSIWNREKDTVALLLTDLVLPRGARGEDLAARLTEEKPALRVVFMSGYGYSSPPDRRSGFLAKPFDMSTLRNKVRQRLDA